MGKMYKFNQLSLVAKLVAIREYMVDDIAFFADTEDEPFTFTEVYNILKDSNWRNFYEDGIIVGGLY